MLGSATSHHYCSGKFIKDFADKSSLLKKFLDFLFESFFESLKGSQLEATVGSQWWDNVWSGEIEI